MQKMAMFSFSSGGSGSTAGLEFYGSAISTSAANVPQVDPIVFSVPPPSANGFSEARGGCAVCSSCGRGAAAAASAQSSLDAEEGRSTLALQLKAAAIFNKTDVPPPLIASSVPPPPPDSCSTAAVQNNLPTFTFPPPLPIVRYPPPPLMSQPPSLLAQSTAEFEGQFIEEMHSSSSTGSSPYQLLSPSSAVEFPKTNLAITSAGYEESSPSGQWDQESE